MKKLIVLCLAVFTAIGAYAQEEKGLHTGFGLATQHWNRGVAFSVAPTVEGDMHYKFCDWFTLGTEATVALNATEGFGNNLNSYMTLSKKNLSLTVKDYYYAGVSNDYWDYGKNTSHFIETSLKYKNDDVYGLVAYTAYQSEAGADNAAGIYFEAGYKVKENLEVTAGYVTDASGVNLRTDAGITHIGINGTRDLKISDSWTSKVKTGLYVNPSYKNVLDAPGISQAPVNFIVSMSF
jgi:hypothetical protein